jgi:anti-sigma B factor antagonist
MLVFAGDKYACIRISGRANFTSSVDFKLLVNELLQKGYIYFVLDLTDCLLMDSTFLGVLAGFGLKSGVPQTGQPQGAIELFNPNARIIDLLESLGVLHLFKISHGDVQVPEKTEEQQQECVAAGAEELKKTCLEAHQTLMKLNPENIARFKDVTQFLAEDLKKLKTKV